MKIFCSYSLAHALVVPKSDEGRSRTRRAEVGRRRITHHHRSGSAVIVVLALLALIFLYLAGNLGTLHHLGRELKLLEQKQTLRLEPAGTNSLQKPKPKPQ